MKILFSDFDGTLISDQKELSNNNKDMMYKLQQQGHLVVICTGRNIKEFQREQNIFHFPFDYLVLNNGGHIVDKNYHTLYEKVIDKQIGIDILKHSMVKEGMWSYFCDGNVNYAYKDGKTYDYSLNNKVIESDFMELCQSAEHFQILCFNQDNQGIEDSKECYDYVKAHYPNDVEICFNTYFVDVVPKGCTKGTGVHKLLELIHQPIDEVYAIGDSYNDLSMIQEADFGYTFHHAHDDIKKETKYHVNYVYEVIEKMLGGNDDELAR
jgi:hypothetical protein